MKMLHQFGDNMIAVRTDAVTYLDTADNFARDFGKSLSAMPEGIDERIYEPGKRHALMREHDVVDGGEREWLEGDRIIAAVATGVGRQSERRQKEQAARMENR
jgi:hypothetical protein